MIKGYIGNEDISQYLKGCIGNDLWDADFWDGIKSGFPLCCILFFCDTWYRLRYVKGKPLENKLFWNWYTGAGHVQCPECVIKEVEPK